MFSGKQAFFGRVTKSFPILKLIDIYDKNSFIREYILDNIFVCLFMYIFFYFAIWYAHKVIERIEKKNIEMLETVERNRVRLDDIISLRDKRAEYEEMVIKAKNSQKTATKQLDNEIKRLSVELVTTSSKLNELEKFLCKMIFSGNFGKAALSDQRRRHSTKGNFRKESRLRIAHTRALRFLNRPFLHNTRLSRRLGNLESLRDRPQQARALLLRKSDSSNRASAETSSTESSYQASDVVPRYHVGQGDRIRICSTSLSSLAPATYTESPAIHRYRTRTRSPFTPSTLNSPSTNPDYH